jgi:hypothetical protein
MTRCPEQISAVCGSLAGNKLEVRRAQFLLSELAAQVMRLSPQPTDCPIAGESVTVDEIRRPIFISRR